MTTGDAEQLGRRVWAIPEGFIPGRSSGDDPALRSHETVSILNAGDADAHVEITVYFEDRDPVGPYRCTVPARRTRHVRFDQLDDPAPVPRDTAYASVVRADVAVVCQHTRLDSRQAANALLSTVAYPG